MAEGLHTEAPLELHRLRADESGISAASPWIDLAAFRITPTSQLGDECLHIPISWVPPGKSRTPSNLVLKVLTFLPEGRGRLECAYHEEQVRRIIFALLMVPRHTQTGVHRLSISSWLNRCRTLLKAANWSLANRFSATSLFRHLDLADLAEMTHGTRIEAVRTLLRDLAYYRARGLLADVPETALGSEVSSGPVISHPEISHKGRTPYQSSVPGPSRQFQPFGDEFVSELISKCLYLSHDLSRSILDAYAALQDRTQWNVRAQHAVLKRRLAAIKGLDWSLADGSHITALPFSIVLRTTGRASSPVSHWPPQAWTEIRGLITALQSANYNIIAFCTGARWSELASAEIDCLDSGMDNTFQARTYKLVGLVGGAKRTWPLPEAALAAVRVQQQLASVVSGGKSKTLWVTHAGAPLNDINEVNFDFINGLSLGHLLEGRPHSHRWRVTIARLGAMALLEAPRILMRLFGHRNIDMTLRYILSNADVRHELREIHQAATYAMSAELFDTLSELGGPGSHRLTSWVHDLQLDASAGSAAPRAEFVELLNISGPGLKIVRPGVICIKQPGQYGPCSKGHGSPNPARCKVHCTHRVETPAGRQHAESVISYIVHQLEDPSVRCEPLQEALLTGQLLTNLRRFDDVRERWLAESSIARNAWADATREGEAS